MKETRVDDPSDRQLHGHTQVSGVVALVEAFEGFGDRCGSMA